MIAAVALTVATTLAPAAPGPGPGLVDAVRMASAVRWNDTVTWNAAVEANAARARRAVPAPVPAGPSTPLAAIRQCESGGDYTAVSPGGAYRGAYQFDRATWASVGGTGDPAAAPPAEQDTRALILYSERGSAPWPVCGR